MGYLCVKCNRKHHSGKIYKEHRHLEKIEIDDIPSNKVVNFEWDLLLNIAKRQIMRFVNKMVWDKRSNFSNKRQMYIHEINRVILHYDNETPILL